jgi:hypothetical protein
MSDTEQSPVSHEHAELLIKSSEPKPNPPDVVPTGHADSTCQEDLSLSGDQQQVRTRFRQGTSRDNPTQNYDDSKSDVREHKTRVMRTRVQEYQPPDVDKLSQNVKQMSVQEKAHRGPQGPKTACK